MSSSAISSAIAFCKLTKSPLDSLKRGPPRIWEPSLVFYENNDLSPLIFALPSKNFSLISQIKSQLLLENILRILPLCTVLLRIRDPLNWGHGNSCIFSRCSTYFVIWSYQGKEKQQVSGNQWGCVWRAIFPDAHTSNYLIMAS